MFKLQLGEIMSMLEGLKVVMAKEFDDVKSAYWLGRAQAQMLTEFQPFDQARMKLVRKYARKDEKGEPVGIETDLGTSYDIEDKEAFNAEYSEIAKQEIEITYYPLAIDGLAGVKGITGEDIAKLGRLIKDDEDEEGAEKESESSEIIQIQEKKSDA